MNVVGIIAEYNPFHSGHKYQFDTIRQQTQADYLIVAMSGDFLQRGTPAITDKHTRAKWALQNGADLVLELPALWACSSAEYFAAAGVSLLYQTGVVNTICYGMEDTNPSLKKDIVEILCNPVADFDQQIALFKKQGFSYPVARAKALTLLLPKYPPCEVDDFLSSPNNILGIEYEKAIHTWQKVSNRPFFGVPIQRMGDGYHTAEIRSNYASATALRNAVFLQSADDISSLSAYLSQTVTNDLQSYKTKNRLIAPDDLSLPLLQKLISCQSMGFADYADCNCDLSDKIIFYLKDFCGFSSFIELLKSKDLTYTRIQRVLTHILLEHKNEDYTRAQRNSYNEYLRILGFRKDSTPLLSEIKKQALLPMITKVADARSFLSDDAYDLFKKDLYAARLYQQIAQVKTGHSLPNEYTQQIVRI